MGRATSNTGMGLRVRLTFEVNGKTRQVVLGTMSPGPFGHEHPADRAQAMLWDYDSYGLPGHIVALDVGAFTEDGELISVAAAKEFFLLTQWSEGDTYHKDLERLAGAKKPTALDRKRTDAPRRVFGEDPSEETPRSAVVSTAAAGVAGARRMYHGAHG